MYIASICIRKTSPLVYLIRNRDLKYEFVDKRS